MPEKIQQIIEKILNKIFLGLNIEANILYNKESDQYRIIIKTDNPKFLIEENGQIIEHIQHIIRVAVHQTYPDDKTHFLLDVNDFRQKRELAIKIKIPDIAKIKVLKEGKTIILVGLSSYERMLIHKILAESKGLNTSSVGSEISRKLLIMPTSEFGSSSMDDAYILKVSEL
jgi:predicted RNA-binding protein Jag